jgi:negative regulator of sigma E activity
MKIYGKPPVQMIPRFRDAGRWRRMAGRLLIASGVLLIVVVFVAAGVIG